MRNPAIILNTLSKHSNIPNYKFERLYRILFNEEMFFVAYQHIYSKQGNMTPGTDSKTVDNMNISRVQKLIDTLKDESYKPQPAKRVYIPKKNGKMRPLGIPSFDDKLVQEVVRMILEAIYEGYFENTSHGFRPPRSCHTALSSIQKGFTGTKWFIEGDIKGFFDNIDHNVLIAILSERISDEKFLRLIRKFLNAGYFEQWKYYKTYSGTPQGGIISPILANIYLDKFDKYMAEYISMFDKGKRRRCNPAYNKPCNKRNSLKRKLKGETEPSKIKELKEKIDALKKEMFSISWGLAMDEQFKRMRYVRYADDFLIGVIGSKADCEQIKADITQYMSANLKLELSAEKTLITNAKTSAKFLGFEMYVPVSNSTKRNENDYTVRSFTKNVVLSVPSDAIFKKLQHYDAIKIDTHDGTNKWIAKERGYMIGKTAEDILYQFNLEIVGFYNYYSIANNIAKAGGTFGYIMEYSLYKTLAQKLNSSIRKINRKYRKNKVFSIPYTDKNGMAQRRVLYNGGFKRKTFCASDSKVDKMPNSILTPRPRLVERLLMGRCELCRNEAELTMHHVRTLNNLQMGLPWEQNMLKRNRKTLAVCPECYRKIISYGK